MQFKPNDRWVIFEYFFLVLVLHGIIISYRVLTPLRWSIALTARTPTDFSPLTNFEKGSTLRFLAHWLRWTLLVIRLEVMRVLRRRGSSRHSPRVWLRVLLPVVWKETLLRSSLRAILNLPRWSRGLRSLTRSVSPIWLPSLYFLQLCVILLFHRGLRIRSEIMPQFIVLKSVCRLLGNTTKIIHRKWLVLPRVPSFLLRARSNPRDRCTEFRIVSRGPAGALEAIDALARGLGLEG